jgi:hypothetical protein
MPNRSVCRHDRCPVAFHLEVGAEPLKRNCNREIDGNTREVSIGCVNNVCFG